MKKILLVLLLCLSMTSMTFAADFTPQGDINLRNVYAIHNATNISAEYYCNSTECHTIGEFLESGAAGTYYAGSNLTLVGSTFALDTTGVLGWLDNIYLKIVDAFSGAYEDLTGKPTLLSYFTDDLGDRGYSLLTNFTDDLGDRGYTHLTNYTDDLGDRGYTSLTNFTDDILWTTNFNSTGDGRWVNKNGDAMTGDLNMGNNDILNVNTINISNITYIHSLRSFDDNSILIQPTGDEDDYFSFKTPLDRPTIKREGGKFIYFESSNVNDVGVSFRKDDTYSGTLAYAKDDNIFKLLGKDSPIAIVPNSEYLNYLLFETFNHQPQISVSNGTILKINDSLEVIGNGNFTGNVTADVFYGDVKIDTINGQTYNYLQDWIDTTQSAGKVSGGTFTSNGDGTVNISSGSGFIKVSDSATANTILFDWDINTSVPLTQGTNYIHIDYNSGNPIVKASTIKVNNRDKILIGKIFREDNVLHMYEAGMYIAEATKNVLGRFVSIDGEFTRANGLILSETGILNIAMTSGLAWGGLTAVSVPSFNSSTTVFEYYYYNSTDWIEEDANQINNSYYNDVATGLEELTVNRYGVHWVYVCNDGHILTVYGQGDYTLANAEASQPPSSLPDHVVDFSLLIGRVLVQKGSSSFYSVEIPSDFTFTSTGATDYNSLINTPTLLSQFTDDLGDRGYTDLINFTNSPGYVTSSTETDPLWTSNSSTVARTGDCPSGQFVQNTTIGGVECAAAAGSGDITSVNTNGPYLTGGVPNGDAYLLLNETVLNASIDARGAGGTYTAGSNLTLTGSVFALDTSAVLTWLNNIYSTITYVDNLINSVGNWSNDKSDYSTTTEANALYRAESWDNFTGIPTATPSNGDITHLSTADHIYDWVIGLGYSTTDGTITSVSAGNGMDFTSITSLGPVVMGTPSTLSGSTANGLTATSHTHEITSDDAGDCAAGVLCGGGHTHSEYMESLLEDTSPQLGGYLDTEGQNIGSTADEIENVYVATDSRIYFGNGQEASMYFNGTSLIIAG